MYPPVTKWVEYLGRVHLFEDDATSPRVICGSQIPSPY